MFSPEFRLLLLSIRHGAPGNHIPEAQALVTESGFDWDQLYRMADINSVKPQLAKLIMGFDPGIVPDKFYAGINKAYQDNTCDQISYAAEFIRINRIMEQAGVTIIPFKGFWLAHEYYGNLGDREAGDIDVFTNFSNLERISRIMLSEGYHVEDRLADYSLNDLEKKAGEYNFDRFEDGKCQFHFEFHWRISSPVYEMGISLEELQTQLTHGSLQEQGFKIFTSSANLLLSVMHHGAKDPFMKLKYASDISGIIVKDDEIDWKWIITTAKRYRLERLVYVSVLIACELTGVPVPHALADKAGKYSVRRLADNRIRFMSKSPGYWHPWITFNDWIFRIRTRSGFGIKLQLSGYIISVVARRFILPRKRRKDQTE